ncbi:MAG: SH3 domain-containing protein [Bacteroidota bacterium]
MKSGSRFVIFLFLALITWACEIPSQQGSGGSGQLPKLDDQLVSNLAEGLTNLSTEFQELARPNKVQAWVSSLIIKAQPGKDMPQIGTLKEGEVAEYLYQRTVRKTEFILRGQRYMEPWILIRTNDGQMGWVHEGGVKYLGANLEQLLGINPTTGKPDARLRGPAGAQDHWVVPGKRVGPITLTTSETELIQLYGPANVSRASVQVPGKGTEDCSVLMGGTKDEIRITWKSAERNRVKAVYFERPDSRWYTQEGLTVGLALGELTKVNKAPITFLGLDWTYGGTVESWQKGSLNKYQKHFYVVLSPNPQASKQLISSFSGNNRYSSNAKTVEGLGLQVGKMVVYLD